MSEKELVSVDFSSEAGLDLKMIDGKLRMQVKYDGHGVDSGAFVDFEADYFLDKLAEAIPGDWDKAPIEGLKLLLKTVS